MKKNIIFWIMLIVLSTMSFGDSPFAPVSLDTSLVLELPTPEHHKISDDYNLHVHAFCAGSGLIVVPTPQNLTCNYGLYSEIAGWSEISDGNLTIEGLEIVANINATNFTGNGDYALIVSCQAKGCLAESPDAYLGGFREYSFSTYEDRQTMGLTGFQINMIIIIILIALILVALATRLALLGVLTSVGVVIYSISLFGISVSIGLITFIAGIFLMLYFLMVEM